MARRLRSWFRLSRAEQARTLEALLLLAAACGAVRLLPFRWYAPLMGQRGAVGSEGADCAAGALPAARGVRRALRRAARSLPWHSTCLMLALAGQIMLRRRRCAGTVFVGVERDAAAAFGFHAWLVAGAVPISGAREAARFTVIATFR